MDLIRADLTTLAVDAIVNAANSSLSGGGGVDGAIHRAGGPQIMAQCRELGRCPTGSAVLTTAGKLRARYVIHAVAPRWRGKAGDAALLASAYATSMRLAKEKGVRSIAFPSLGTGAYGYPVEPAAKIALSTVAVTLESGGPVNAVTFALFSQADLEAYCAQLQAIAKAC